MRSGRTGPASSFFDLHSIGNTLLVARAGFSACETSRLRQILIPAQLGQRFSTLNVEKEVKPFFSMRLKWRANCDNLASCKT